jgi:guanylate kinase
VSRASASSNAESCSSASAEFGALTAPVASGANQPLILVVSGPGGVGKGTVVDRLLELEPRLWLSRSWTTRPPRPGETDSSYVFSDLASFRARLERGGFLEWTEFPGNGHLYGTPTLEPPPGRDVLLEIELHGARQVKQAYPDALVTLIVAPDVDEQRSRLRRRGDDERAVDRRVEVGVEEERQGRLFADAVVVNDEVDRAAAEVAGILAARRSADGRVAPPR